MDGVMGDRFCLNYPVGLIVEKKTGLLSNGRFEAFDINGQLLLHVDKKTFARNWVMHDPAGLDILSISEKIFSLRQRWMVHRGSSKRGNLLFTTEISSIFSLNSPLKVEMKMNTRNFEVKGGYSSHSFDVYEGIDVVAEVKQSSEWGSIWGGNKYTVRVCAGVDYALIVALIVIMDTRITNHQQQQSAAATTAATAAADAAAAAAAAPACP